MMTQDQALRILASGRSVLLTGAAGSGKTYVLRQFIAYARKKKQHVAVTATTGLAATHLDGSTIHRWSGIGVRDSLPRGFVETLPDSRIDQIRRADILVIDEISMLHDYRLDMVEEVTRTARKIDAPFGGLQVVLCGDFFQLPPVNRAGSRTGGFVTNSAAWAALDPTICYLDEQHRTEDEGLLGILNAIRTDSVEFDHAETLQSRKGASIETDGQVTELYTTNVDVDRINQRRLDAIPKLVKQYQMSTTGKQAAVESLQGSCLAPELLELKVGALVMCIRNSQTDQYVNGSLGTVVGFDEETDLPIVKLHRNQEKIRIEPATWELRDGETKRATLTQLPLKLAWAVTVHKSQGMTLDAARIDLGRAFVEGMGYVALSRVRELRTLELVGFNRMALSVSPEALRIDEHLRIQSENDRERYKDLPAFEQA